LSNSNENDDKYGNILRWLSHFQYAVPVREAASNALAYLMRSGIKSLTKRLDIINKMTAEFAKGKTFTQRMVFLDFCGSIAKYFSRKFFKERLWDTALELATDRVTSVKIKLCRLLITMKKMIKQPFDTPQLKKLIGVVQLLKSDKAKGVVQMATEAEETISHIEGSLGMESAEDVLDRQKEQEEEELAQQEEKESEETRRKEEEARNEFRRKLAEKDQEISMKNRIFGTKRQKHPAVTGVGLEPLYDKVAIKKDRPKPSDSKKTAVVTPKKSEISLPPPSKPLLKQEPPAPTAFPSDNKKGVTSLMSNLKVDPKPDVQTLLAKDMQRKALPALSSPMPTSATVTTPTSLTTPISPNRPNSGGSSSSSSSGGKIVLTALPKKTSASGPPFSA
jgi:hypothetical protein